MVRIENFNNTSFNRQSQNNSGNPGSFKTSTPRPDNTRRDNFSFRSRDGNNNQARNNSNTPVRINAVSMEESIATNDEDMESVEPGNA